MLGMGSIMFKFLWDQLRIKKAGKTTFIFLFLISVLFVPQTSNASTIAKASIIVNGMPTQTTYFMQNGYVMVPAVFFEKTGAAVDWNEQYQSVVLKRNNIILALPSGKNYVDYSSTPNDWKRDYLSTTTTDLSDGTYIPLQYTAEKLGMKIIYDSFTSTTYVDTTNGNVYFKGNSNKKLVALTFDDGPDNIYTPKILDILEAKGVPATFFIVGSQAQYFPDMLKRIVKDGFAIGNHTWDHPELPKLTPKQITQEIGSTEDEIQKVTGLRPDLFRPPYGEYTDQDIQLIRNLGYRVVMWSVDTIDWSGASGDQILSRVNQKISPGGIILQHCIQFKPGVLDGTVEALPKIIDQLRSEGYQFVTVQTLLTSN
jgi:delta-lactam-biosynthetic de-N-acetylase